MNIRLFLRIMIGVPYRDGLVYHDVPIILNNKSGIKILKSLVYSGCPIRCAFRIMANQITIFLHSTISRFLWRRRESHCRPFSICSHSLALIEDQISIILVSKFKFPIWGHNLFVYAKLLITRSLSLNCGIETHRQFSVIILY